MPRVDAKQAARAILSDAHTLTSTIDAALPALDVGKAGWPTSTPGAAPAEPGPLSEGRCDEQIPVRLNPGNVTVNVVCGNPLPCRDHPTRSSSITERTAFTPDKARSLDDELHEHIRKAHHHLARAARISLAWGTIQLDKSEVARRLEDLQASIWCVNCAKQGRNEPRMEGGGVRCEFCQGYHDRFHEDPSRRIFDCRQGRGGRIFESDILRIRQQEKTEAQEKKKADKARAEADRRAQRKAS